MSRSYKKKPYYRLVGNPKGTKAAKRRVNRHFRRVAKQEKLDYPLKAGQYRYWYGNDLEYEEDVFTLRIRKNDRQKPWALRALRK